MITRENIIPGIGLLLLGVVFLISAKTVIKPRFGPEKNREEVVIRFAHWQLEAGLRDVLDSLSREYETLHPGVKIEQIAIPSRIYPQWAKTQLIGETAPDLLQISKSFDDEIFARFFVPLRAQVEEPNLYNAGSELASAPWRNTFLDGLVGSYRPNLLDYYGIPLSMFTVRMYYNKELWRRLLGGTPEPADFEAFMKICATVGALSTPDGGKILPIAGSLDNAPLMIGNLVSSQTQRLAQQINLNKTMMATPVDIGISYLRGSWNQDTPAFADALSIARDVSLSMQPGYEQLKREDATFYFVQGKALMITTGSWDAPSFRQQSPFEIGVFHIPLPDANHPRYGKNIMGSPSEADTPAAAALGLTRVSRHPAQALDFLRFLTAQKNNGRFSRESGWLPSVTGIIPTAEVKPFWPTTDGYVQGFNLNLGFLGSDSARIINTHMHLLVQPTGGSVARYQQALRAGLGDAIRLDLERITQRNRSNLARQDIAFAGNRILANTSPADPTWTRKTSALIESQNLQESLTAWISSELENNKPGE